jgi:hypothetical protein
MFLSGGSFLTPEVDTLLVSSSSAIFTILSVGSDHLCYFPCWFPVDQHCIALCLSMPSVLLLLREVLDSAILQIDLNLGGHHGSGNNQVA